MSKIIFSELEYTSSDILLKYFINFKPPLAVCPIDKQEYCLTFSTKYTKEDGFNSFDFESRCKFCSKKYEEPKEVIEKLGLNKEKEIAKILTTILKKRNLIIECTWSQAIQFILED